jgi:hypothetical protein
MKQSRPEWWWSIRQARRLGELCSAMVAGVLASSSPAVADEAPSKATCAHAYESAQESRAAGQLEETRSRLAFCAQAECPAFVQRDCARWLEEVQRELPSVVVSLAGPAAQSSSVRVQLDGKPITERLGKPIELDPGRHELVVERPGEAPVTRTIVAQQGVQNRAVTVELDANAPPPVPPLASPPPLLDQPDTSASGASPLRSLAYAAWGVGLVGLGTFAVLGTLGRADERSLRDDCPLATDDPSQAAPGVCTQTDIDHRKSNYQREYVVADVGLYTGLAAAITGTALFVLSSGASRPKDSASKEAGAGRPSLDLGVAPRPGGAWATLSGSF